MNRLFLTQDELEEDSFQPIIQSGNHPDEDEEDDEDDDDDDDDD